MLGSRAIAVILKKTRRGGAPDNTLDEWPSSDPSSTLGHATKTLNAEITDRGRHCRTLK